MITKKNKRKPIRKSAFFVTLSLFINRINNKNSILRNFRHTRLLIKTKEEEEKRVDFKQAKLSSSHFSSFFVFVKLY